MINKPINPYPYNCCVDLNNDLNIEYEIQNEKITGRYISINNMETGKSVLESYENLSEPTNKIKWNAEKSLSQYGENEYSWSSFYWQEPATLPDKTWTVSNIDTQTGSIHLKADLKPGIGYLKPIPELTKSTRWEMYKNCTYMMGYNSKKYDYSIFSIHALPDGANTSSMCSVGVLEDYFGYPCIEVGADFLDLVVDRVGIGKCVIDIYDENNKLVARTRCLAYDYINPSPNNKLFPGYLIIDNPKFGENIANKFKEYQIIKEETQTTATPYDDKIISYHYAHLYSVESLDEQANISGMLRHGDLYCSIRDYNYSTHEYIVSTQPVISGELEIGDSVSVWTQNSNGANFNTSPAYYFRYKSAPQIAINDFSQLQTKNETNILNDVKCKFGITYSSSNYKLNYFYLYIYAFNSQTSKWELQERTPMLYTTEDTYEFIGLYHNQKYKVFAVCTDKDGDEWTSEELEFTIDNPSITTYDIPAVFNRSSTTIDISLIKLLSSFKDATLEFYKVINSDMVTETKLQYAGRGIAKMNGTILFDKWCDYNICNDTYYDYYIRVDYKKDDGTSGIEWVCAATDIHTEFCGTSILGLERVGDTQLKIVNNFNIFYRFDRNIGELSNELSREYMSSFGRYPKELKGHQNYISGSLSGLLGDECNGIYVEPKGIRKAWNKFVDDDTVKLYRGFDGETMIISIDTNKVKPSFYPGSGMVNEVSITFKEIAPANRYAIFSTAMVGD